MSVIVKGMKMPKSCGECRFLIDNWCYTAEDNGMRLNSLTRKPSWCPLVALPEKHGRLIDGDALCEDLLKRWDIADTRKEELIRAVMADIATPIIVIQPTVIEEEDG